MGARTWSATDEEGGVDRHPTYEFTVKLANHGSGSLDLTCNGAILPAAGSDSMAQPQAGARISICSEKNEAFRYD